MKKSSVFLLLFWVIAASQAQTINPDLLNKPWTAQWITGPGDKGLNMWNMAAEVIRNC
jgi:hypothetical protein